MFVASSVCFDSLNVSYIDGFVFKSVQDMNEFVCDTDTSLYANSMKPNRAGGGGVEHWAFAFGPVRKMLVCEQ